MTRRSRRYSTGRKREILANYSFRITRATLSPTLRTERVSAWKERASERASGRAVVPVGLGQTELVAVFKAQLKQTENLYDIVAAGRAVERL